MKDIFKTIQTNKQFWLFVFMVVYFMVGVLFGDLYRRELRDTWALMRSSNSLQREEKNLQYFGAIYLAVNALSQTSLDSKILFITPDMNWVPRMMVFLYPRQLRAVPTPDLALQKLITEDFDYVVVYVEYESYSGLIGGLSYFQQYYWTDEGMTEFLYSLPGLSGYSKQELVELIDGNYGVLVYPILQEES